MLMRSSSLEKGMSQYLVDQINSTDNIEVRLNTVVTGVVGDRQLEAIAVSDRHTGATETVPTKAMFLFIDAVPHSEMVARVVERNRVLASSLLGQICCATANGPKAGP